MMNPGSDEAIAKGCICPVLDNGHGKGSGRVDEDGNPQFWVTQGCPIHDPIGFVVITEEELEQGMDARGEFMSVGQLAEMLGVEHEE